MTMAASAVRAPKPSPAARAAVQKLIDKAKLHLVIHHPFFMSVVLKRDIIIDDNVPTACVNARGTIRIGTDFGSKLTVAQMVHLLAHEGFHYMFLHPSRRGTRNPRKWNYAGDAVINDVLVVESVGEKIEGGVYLPGSSQKTTEQVYDELPEDAGGRGGRPGPNDGWDDLDETGGDGEDLTESEIREIEQTVKEELAAAAQVAKQQGKLPASVEGLVNSILYPKTPWHKLLAPLMQSFVRGEVSFRKPNRRYAYLNLYLPSTDKEPKLGTVVIARDSSGSCMDQPTQASFIGHIGSILESCRPEKIVLIDCDASVHKVSELTVDDLPIQPTSHPPVGGGGTSFKPPFKWVAENLQEDPEVLIYLTDMYGNFPDRAPGYPVVWLSTSPGQVGPFGTTIEFDVNNQ